MTDLRPFQIDAIAEIDKVVAAGKKRPLLVAPTGAGKTVILAAIIKRAVAEGLRVIVLAHRREIIAQTSRKLSAHHVEHGIIQAGLVMDLEHNVQVCSIQTVTARAMRTNKIPLPWAGSADHRRSAPRPRSNISGDHRSVSGCHFNWHHGNTVPWR